MQILPTKPKNIALIPEFGSLYFSTRKFIMPQIRANIIKINNIERIKVERVSPKTDSPYPESSLHLRVL